MPLAFTLGLIPSIAPSVPRTFPGCKGHMGTHNLGPYISVISTDKNKYNYFTQFTAEGRTIGQARSTHAQGGPLNFQSDVMAEAAEFSQDSVFFFGPVLVQTGYNQLKTGFSTKYAIDFAILLNECKNVQSFAVLVWSNCGLFAVLGLDFQALLPKPFYPDFHLFPLTSISLDPLFAVANPSRQHTQHQATHSTLHNTLSTTPPHLTLCNALDAARCSTCSTLRDVINTAPRGSWLASCSCLQALEHNSPFKFIVTLPEVQHHCADSAMPHPTPDVTFGTPMLSSRRPRQSWEMEGQV
ncbi:uncharacterized protein LACBIDRAFT_331062 [Laccaria bicolor S238N-H82]|uniref:Predicted protein n=1 Tax=Laccaria bicolor (strain S238N-H82 / ATCC MYA-4686) TaxID=486041 RepID=B0DNB4_LACBS|nr:uncharacterized protein LACBIDRAFT_331062 [Laccaria bicolor S238N-H82]EDR03837.1 predicted protein [Laccaria bicolor S238N-H82]|eukprot:XP_001885405.1 predicted protein [Laccaria bicolor S238N-H82]